MKKKTRYILPLAVIFVILIAGVAVFRFWSDKEDIISVSFTEGEPHTYTLDFALYFETMSGTLDSFTVNIQQEIYNEEAASNAVNTIYGDMKKLKKIIGKADILFPECVLYIVEETPNGIRIFGNRVYCTYENIQEGTYLEALAGIVLETDEPWKGIGIAQLVREKEPNEQAVASYLEQAENLDILSLFAAYFHPDFAGEEDRQTATALAAMLCDMVLEEQGVDTLLGTPCVEYRQELLDKLGIGKVYSDPYQGFDMGYTYNGSLWYSFVVTTPRGDEIYVQPMPDDMTTPGEVRYFLYEISAASQAILEGIQANAPKNYAIIADNYSEPITYLLDPNDSSYAEWNSRTIHLRHTCHVVHETVHIMIPAVDEDNRWKYEGAANYFMEQYYPPKYHRELYFGGLKEWTEADLLTAENEKSYNELEWILAGHDIYLSEYGMPANAFELNVRQYMNARMKAYYQGFSEKISMMPISEWYRIRYAGYMIAPKNGNELSYDEAACFVDYLIQNYSMDSFLQLCIDPKTSFGEIYGMDYDEIKQLWLEEMLEN